MKLGVWIFPTDTSIGLAKFAKAAEDRGFESVWCPEHTHVPADRRTPYPGGGELPTEYYRTCDPFISLAAAAAVTTTIRVGTAICLVAQRDTILLAKEVATLDLISEGRFEFGVGYGWNVEEMAAHGVNPKERHELVKERILAMKQLWLNEIGEFHGDLIDLEPSFQWPKPLQRPHPPVLLGGSGGPKLIRNVVAIADGWISMPGGSVSATRKALVAECDRVDRDPNSISITACGPPPKAEVLEKYRTLGVDRVAFVLPAAGEDVVLRELDHLAGFIADFAD